MEKCRSCGAKIIWAVTEKGRRMPIDPQPVGRGNIQLRQQPPLPPLAVYLGQDTIAHLPPGQLERLLTSHFATCPQANKWRKKDGR